MSDLLSVLEPFPATRRLVGAVLDVMPGHHDYLVKSFMNRSQSTQVLAEQSAILIEQIKEGDLSVLAQGYRWLCEMIQEEELYFRRSRKYRNSSFQEVDAAVYQNHAEMSQYMDGLLATEVIWIQHARAMDFYVNTFLKKQKQGYRHLEVGPGHGLLFYYPAVDPRCESLHGWDISPASLDQTRTCMRMVAPDRSVELETCDIMSRPQSETRWNSIVISEVLEHLEEPAGALKNLRECIAPDGHLYVNVPVNAPTIDHIYLFRSPEDAVTMVEKCGFIVDEVLLAPGAGYTITRSRKIEASLTVALSARPA